MGGDLHEIQGVIPQGKRGETKDATELARNTKKITCKKGGGTTLPVSQRD